MVYLKRLSVGWSPVQRIALLSVALLAQSLVWAEQKLLPAQSSITFISKQMGVPVEGRFQSFSGQVAFNPSKLEAASIGLSIDLASATLGAAETDAELAKPDWFHTAKFPKAQFQSVAVKKLSAQQWQVDGKLTIKGMSQNVQVPVTLTQSGTTTIANGAFTIARLAYKIGDNAWSDTSMVANEVQVKFKLALTGVGKL